MCENKGYDRINTEMVQYSSHCLVQGIQREARKKGGRKSGLKSQVPLIKCQVLTLEHDATSRKPPGFNIIVELFEIHQFFI
jgi:hypothetical protein